MRKERDSLDRLEINQEQRRRLTRVETDPNPDIAIVRVYNNQRLLLLGISVTPEAEVVLPVVVVVGMEEMEIVIDRRARVEFYRDNIKCL